MTKKMIRKIALVLAIAMITQCGFGLKLFSIDVKASTGTANTVTEIEAGSIEVTTGQNENTGSGDSGEVVPTGSGGETVETATDETSSDLPTETPTETPSETETPTEPVTTQSSEIIDGLYRVKKGVLVEYVGDKEDKTITTLTIPAKVTTINEYVFEDCKYIKTLKFAHNSKIATIYQYAFKGCDALKTVTLPGTLKIIGYKAFALCPALKKLTIPSSVTYGNQILGSKSNVTSVTFKKGMKTIPSNILKNANRVETVSISSTTVTVGASAFYGCSSLKKVSLPSTTTTINTYAFYGCKNMTGFTMSSNIKTIGKYAFKNCSKVKKITLYKTIVSIGDGAFTNDSKLTLLVYANSKGKAYARAKKLKWDYTNSEKKRRAANQTIYDNYLAKVTASDKKKYKLKYLSDYVPQGTCVLGKYVIVSMYHKHLAKRSILVVYSKSTGKFVKNIVLPNYDHVGAITNVKGRLVVSLNNISTPDYGAVYSYSKIKKAKHGKVLKPGYRVRFSGDADFAIFDGTYFWAGKSANTNYATMQGYKVKIKKKKLTFTRKFSYYVPANSQGLIVQKISKTNRRFIFAQSYGRLKNSSLITYKKKVSKAGGLGSPVKTETLPCMLEGICMSGNKYIFFTFESGASLYCGNPDNTSELQIKFVCRISKSKMGF